MKLHRTVDIFIPSRHAKYIYITDFFLYKITRKVHLISFNYYESTNLSFSFYKIYLHYLQWSTDSFFTTRLKRQFFFNKIDKTITIIQLPFCLFRKYEEGVRIIALKKMKQVYNQAKGNKFHVLFFLRSSHCFFSNYKEDVYAHATQRAHT